jgi:SAM-dependent methyltransferase
VVDAVAQKEEVMRRHEHESPETPPQVFPAARAGHLSSPVRRLLNNPARILRGLVHEGDTVVDLGCGPGFFAIPLASMVGDQGHVIAVDLQPEMLEQLRVVAEEAGLASRIVLHACDADSFEVAGTVDFALAFHIAHEIPDRERFSREIAQMLKPGGLLLLVEPRVIVSRAGFHAALEAAEKAGLVTLTEPRVFFNRAALLQRRSSERV